MVSAAMLALAGSVRMMIDCSADHADDRFAEHADQPFIQPVFALFGSGVPVGASGASALTSLSSLMSLETVACVT